LFSLLLLELHFQPLALLLLVEVSPLNALVPLLKELLELLFKTAHLVICARSLEEFLLQLDIKLSLQALQLTPLLVWPHLLLALLHTLESLEILALPILTVLLLELNAQAKSAELRQELLELLVLRVEIAI